MTLKTGNKGFTLLEVLITVTIISVGIAGILRAYIVSLDAMRSSQEYVILTGLAKERMMEILLLEKENKGMAVGLSEGNFDPPYAHYNWSAEVASTDIPDLNSIKLSVTNTDMALSKEFSLVNYVQNKKD